MPSFLAGIVRLVLRVAICLLAAYVDCRRGGPKIRRQNKQGEEHEREAGYASIVLLALLRCCEQGAPLLCVFGAMSCAGNPPEEIVVQKVVPTLPELSLEIGVLWLGYLSQALVPSLCPLITGGWGRHLLESDGWCPQLFSSLEV